MAKSHHHNTKTNKTQHTQAAALYPDGTGRRVSFRTSSGCRLRIPRTRMPVRRTIPSTRHGETTERRADVPLGDSDVAHSRSVWLSSHSSTTASTRLHCRPTVSVPIRPADRSALTPAVAYDGDLVVSRRTLAPGLVRRADAAPCVPPATAHWNRSSPQPAAAALTMRSSTSPHTVYQTRRYLT